MSGQLDIFTEGKGKGRISKKQPSRSPNPKTRAVTQEELNNLKNLCANAFKRGEEVLQGLADQIQGVDADGNIQMTNLRSE